MNSNLKNGLLVAGTALATYFGVTYSNKSAPVNALAQTETRGETTICMDYQGDAPATLTTDLIKSMVNKYQDNQLNYIQSAPSTEVPSDARAIWFDIETLKSFLYHVEHNAANNPEQSRDRKLGIRIYYAAYPNNKEMEKFAQSQTDPTFGFNPAFEHHHTLVMIPTISNKEGQNLDFNPLDEKTYDGFVNMKEKGSYLQNNYETLSIGISADPAVQGAAASATGANMARNHGQLFPPMIDSSMGF